MTYYLVNTKVAVDTGKDVKWTREFYLVEAESVMDAETKVNADWDSSNIEFEVVQVTKSNVIKVL